MTQNMDNTPSAFSPDNALLAEYLAGRASDSERIAVESWLTQNPERVAEMELLGIVWSAPDCTVSVDETQAFITRWRTAALQTDVPKVYTTSLGTTPSVQIEGLNPKQSHPWNVPRWGWQAATAVLTLLLVAFVFRTPNVTPNSSTTTYSTRNGERAEITLSDGTHVSLNVGSRIDIPDNFNRGDRTIHLTGEASFHVRHAAGTPFTVMAGPSITRVLGTRFVVRHYAEDSTALVSVRDGKVAMNNNIVLTAMQQAQVSFGGISPITRATPGQFTFESGVLTLGATPLPEAISELNRWYDADIHLGDASLIAQQIAGEFATGSISDLAEILDMTYGVRVVRNGRNLTLFSR